MLTTYQRLMDDQRVTRHREATVDNRPAEVLIAEYRATIEVLRWEIAKLRQATQQTRQRMKDTCRGMEG